MNLQRAKWRKRLLLSAACVVGVLMVLVVAAYLLAVREPADYRPPQLSPVQQEKAEKREAQRVAREAKLEADPDALVREAQIRYVGDRILIGDGKTEKTPKEHRGNLLKLAKTRQK